MKLVLNAKVVAPVGAEVRAVDTAAVMVVEVVVDAEAMAEVGVVGAAAEVVAVIAGVTAEAMVAEADGTVSQTLA